MAHQDLLNFLEHSGKDPSRLIFEDELTGIYNRRFLYQYLEAKVRWDAMEDHPLSLMMMDVDKFKQINDQYGHQTGDNALIWVAGLLKKVAGDEGLAIRYAGDEFMMLLPQMDKQASLKKAEQLYNEIHKESFHQSSLDSPLQITLSTGIASAPQDAENSKSLIQKADTALYASKKKGRDCFVNASEISQAEVFDKAAIYQLEGIKIVGRGRQVSQVTDILQKFSKKKSQFLIMEGPAGIGKTEFLDVIRQGLARKKIWMVKVNGSPHEMFRPYYLTVKILLGILNQRKDKGEKVLESLSPGELSYLAQIIPQFGGDAEALEDDDESAIREGIFTTLVHLIPKLLDNRPLILFIDDLHFCDEATMLLLRMVILREDIPIFVCSSSSENKAAKAEEEKSPLDRFYATYHQELNILKVPLTPLTASDIANMIHTLFPNVSIPENFEKDLVQICHGNPLFIGEIFRKLIQDQKIALIGQQWVIHPLGEGYLPESLEEIVTQKIAALDEDGRKMLEQVSALGEDVPLSMLTGSSDTEEAKVLEFIDQAVVQGLLRLDFQLNDEVVRFLGKRVLEITYGTIDQDRKQELHERIGNYQETLHERQLLLSAATLAFHFKRSRNQQKARVYEHMLASSNDRRFNAQEAVIYTAEAPIAGPEADVPLDPKSLANVPKLIRDFLVTLRNIKLYPPGSKSIIKVTHKLKETIYEFLENNERLNITQEEQAIVINGQKIATSDFKVIAQSFLDFLDQFQLKGIAFHRGLTDKEVEIMLEAFGRIEQKTLEDHYWESLMVENQMEHIELKQIRYTRRGKPDVSAKDQITRTGSPKGAPSLLTGELGKQEMRFLVEIMRSLLGASRSIKLYPLDSKVVTVLLKKLMEYLRSFIEGRGVLTLSRAEDALLINGEKVIASDFKGPADKFQKYLATIGLSSLTFLKRFTAQELEAFIIAHGDLPTEVVESNFWKRLAREKGLSGILFDQHIYDVRVAETAEPSGSSEILIEEQIQQSQPQQDEAVEMEPFTSILNDFQDQLSEMFLKEEEKGIKQAINKVFLKFQDQAIPDRKMAIEVCGNVMESLTPSFQADFAKFLVDPLLSAFSEEKNPDIITEMAAFLGSMVTLLIEFVEYQAAGRIVFYLHKRRRELEEAKDPHALMLTKTLERKLEHSTQKLLLEDLKSGDPGRLRNAALLLSSLGQVAVPFLFEIIKQEDDFRSRKIAAVLLEKQGTGVADRLKNLLVLEVTPEERSRILDVIDTLTSDLKTELGQALRDEDPEVRKAAFRLAERLNNNQTIELLLDLAKGRKVNQSVSAIKCLGKLNPPKIDEEFIALLNSTKEEDLCIVCCRALGQIASHAAIEPLSKILLPKGFFPFRKKRSVEVRAAAALALGQISHPRVSEVLAPFVDDGDTMVREIAKSVVRPAESSQQ